MPLRVLLISDGRPGHFRQSEGIVLALSRLRPVVVDRLELTTRFPLPRSLPLHLARHLPARLFLRLVHGLQTIAPKPDLIVSAGAATLGANCALAGLLGVPNIFSGSPRGFDDRIRLAWLPYRSAARRAPAVYGLKPSLVDPDTLPSPSPGLAGGRLAVLLGGPTREIRFDAEDWSLLAGFLGTLPQRFACTVQVITSRRTPAEAYPALTPLEGTSGIELVDFRRAGVGSINAAFASDLLFVTLDSLSMISEAVASRRPVVVLEPAAVGPSRDLEAIGDMAAEGVLARLPIAEAKAETIETIVAGLRPMQANHLDILGRTILDRLAL